MIVSSSGYTPYCPNKLDYIITIIYQMSTHVKAYYKYHEGSICQDRKSFGRNEVFFIKPQLDVIFCLSYSAKNMTYRIQDTRSQYL